MSETIIQIEFFILVGIQSSNICATWPNHLSLAKLYTLPANSLIYQNVLPMMMHSAHCTQTHTHACTHAQFVIKHNKIKYEQMSLRCQFNMILSSCTAAQLAVQVLAIYRLILF